jgi:hypothetical protein
MDLFPFTGVWRKTPTLLGPLVTGPVIEFSFGNWISFLLHASGGDKKCWVPCKEGLL